MPTGTRRDCMKLKTITPPSHSVPSGIPLSCAGVPTEETGAAFYMSKRVVHHTNELHQRLIEEGWMSPDTYAKNFSYLPNGPGLYILAGFQLSAVDADFGAFKICYVGMSENLANRLGCHPVSPLVRQQGFHLHRMFKTCAKDELRKSESALIRRYNPPFNINGKTRGAI